MKINEITLFTHNDLDALGCMLNIHAALPTTRVETFHTNYRNIHERVEETIAYVNRNSIPLVIITDVSFSQHRDLLVSIIETGAKIIYLDHHIYPTGFFEGLKMDWVHDTERSATQITYDYFSNQGKSENLDAITQLINTYDLWKIKDEHFNTSLELNEYFWGQGIDWLFSEITTNGYKLPRNYLEFVSDYNSKADAALKKYYQKGLIHQAGNTSIAFIDEFFNNVLLKEFGEGKEILLIANSYGIIRIRFNQFSTIDKTIKEAIKVDICGTADTGHLNAFTVKVEHNSFEHIMGEIKRIMAIMKKHIKE